MAAVTEKDCSDLLVEVYIVVEKLESCIVEDVFVVGNVVRSDV